ncbi:diaminopimelate decarboxylase [Fructilactobacillus fructivorans]|uniref:Diaminopimelate decarboxylase n=1 Tax=Fructilactobacillus fructivorans TaxID=1614 RepID=A0AAE6TVW4_9LACO|nr:diaminopimelate decarboxylase [Fructilactobacillus fructivorans]KRK57141.1 diaminopimelate decarboxylase [Fructilactobacillus fructivorans]KRN40385.1 diaminopimelate decarboxylase [Fructilactobacillus fructivorans]KRN42727.1 diaminopimelate decarboxylase [Fructilactobacillus fructivorans]QFX92369.1 diaminopimelate decarboxylase [Fructilactobacillus fructivorans]RDV64921.1 diaminopimelate decarboxylase [Fructilactobacillus fructivorans]
MMKSVIDKQDIRDHDLYIGGIKASDLAKEYGTPLEVYDVTQIRSQIRKFKQVFEERHVDYSVNYASKAFATIGMYQIVKQEGAGIDVVSGGELFTALQADFPMKRVSFHGNNKSKDELEMAVKNGVGTIMLDNFHEIDLLHDVLEGQNANIDVMLRITPGISAHTHEYIQTGQVDSKFGFDLGSGQADEALQRVLKEKRMNMKGVHAHIGSQIFSTKGFVGAADKLVDVMKHWHDDFGYTAKVVNVGGGFGIQYTDEEHPVAPEEFVSAIVDEIKQKTKSYNLPTPAIWIEPGRSIVGTAGYSLYTIGSRKDVSGIKSYVAVDGGMGDNIRPALYEADYEGALANNADGKPVEDVRIAGKYCESGDILIQNQPIPKSKPGDIFVIFNTGAYGYSMASNYNRNPRPAVVFVESGKSQIAVKRESYADLSRLDTKLKEN